MPDEIENHLPLSPLSFQILLALADGRRHGYAIMKEIAEAGAGLTPGAGSLYAALDRLLAAQLIAKVEAPDEETDPRRRYYGLTAFGRQVARAESVRLLELLKRASRKKVAPAELMTL